MRKKDWENIEEKIKTGIYKLVRLVKMNGNESVVIVGYNKITHNPIDRLNYIKSKQNDLEAGEYLVQCRVSPTNHELVDSFKLIIKPRTILINGSDVEDKTNEQTTMANDIDLDDYIKAIKEAEQLKATNIYLMREIEYYQRELQALRDNKAVGLSDNSENSKSTAEIITSAIGDSLSAFLPIADRYFGLQEKKIELEGRKIESGKKSTVVKSKKLMAKKTIEQEAEEIALKLEELEETNPEEFNNKLDEMEENDPELYDMVCSILGIEEETEQSEEGESDE